MPSHPTPRGPSRPARPWNLWMVALLAILAACTKPGSFQGRLVDGLTGQPIAGARLLAKAPDSLDLTCQVFEATTGEDGSFTFAKTCPDTRYRIESTDETLLLADMEPFDGGAQQPPVVEVKAWRGAKGGGLYIVEDGKVNRVPTSADISRKTILDSDEEVLYPAAIPGTIHRVKPGSYLLVATEGSIKKLEFFPLIQDENKRRFGTRKEWTTLDPWWYVGVKFESDTKFERVAAEMDASKVTDVTVQGVQLRYIEGSALPPGRYAIMGKKDRRMYIIDFGPEG